MEFKEKNWGVVERGRERKINASLFLAYFFY